MVTGLILFDAIMEGPDPWCKNSAESDGGKDSEKFVWNDADYHCNGKRYGPKSEGDGPLCTAETSRGQDTPSKEDDDHLSSDCNEIDTNKVPVSMNALEDVEIIIKTAIAATESARRSLESVVTYLY